MKARAIVYEKRIFYVKVKGKNRIKGDGGEYG
jgi:hypothetical protein